MPWYNCCDCSKINGEDPPSSDTDVSMVGHAPDYIIPGYEFNNTGIDQYDLYESPTTTAIEDEEDFEFFPRRVEDIVEPPPQSIVTFSPVFSRALSYSGSHALQHQTDVTSGKGYHHGVRKPGTWLNDVGWPTWDGVPLANICSLTAAQIASFVWPNNDVWRMRGLQQLFEQLNPFQDISNPTVAEVESWNLAVMNHYRALLGQPPLTNSYDMFLRAQWANERKHTTVWDSDYPNDTCGAGSPVHCGGNFIPNAAHQTPYFTDPSQQTVASSSSAEVVVSQSNIDWPWSVKFSRILRGIVVNDGLYAHGGPLIGRSFVGYHFHITGTTSTLRIKFGGALNHPCT